ncbi:MAG TPA: YoaK family protein [Novosphingobium sp.]|nr:YoaK family protein [Novosphingobium sp.]
MNRLDRSRQRLAIGLAALAGYVDGVGFIESRGFFVSFMSGNTTRLAVELVQDWRLALLPAGLIAGFITGVAAGAFVSERAGRWGKPAVLALVAMLLAHAAAFRASEPGHALALLVFAMGAINNTFRRDGEVVVGLTYMTGALVRLGQALGAGLAGRRHTGWAAHGLLWLGLALGAIGGASLHTRAPGLSLWLAVAACALACRRALGMVRSSAGGQMPSAGRPDIADR